MLSCSNISFQQDKPTYEHVKVKTCMEKHAFHFLRFNTKHVHDINHYSFKFSFHMFRVEYYSLKMSFHLFKQGYLLYKKTLHLFKVWCKTIFMTLTITCSNGHFTYSNMSFCCLKRHFTCLMSDAKHVHDINHYLFK